MRSDSAYGLWSLVILNSVIFNFFAFSFVKSRTKQDWRHFRPDPAPCAAAVDGSDLRGDGDRDG